MDQNAEISKMDNRDTDKIRFPLSQAEIDELPEREAKLYAKYATEMWKKEVIENAVWNEVEMRDYLTQLRNRNAYNEFCNRLISKKVGFSLMYIDLGNFKKINDKLGHEEGDKALQSYSHFLLGVFRKHDVVFRLGGDEFAVVLTIDNGQEIEKVVARLTSLLADLKIDWEKDENPARLLEQDIGYAVWDLRSDERLEELTSRAEKKMYESKNIRKGGINEE